MRTNGGRLMLRAGSSTSSQILAKMPNGSSLTILSQKGEAVPLEPPEIVEAVRKGAQATLDSLVK